MTVRLVTPCAGTAAAVGFPAAGAGVAGADPELRVAFFALLYDQDLATPIRLFARDEAGNESHASLDYKAFPKPFSAPSLPQIMCASGK